MQLRSDFSPPRTLRRFALHREENNLFFSSNGLPGFGGYDVYCSKYTDESWDMPVNLSKRINSQKDEVAFTLSKKDVKMGFITIKENSPGSEMKLYKLGLSEEYQKSGMNLSSLLINLALLEGIVPATELIAQEKKTIEKDAAPIVEKEIEKKKAIETKPEIERPILVEKETKSIPEPEILTTATEILPVKTEAETPIITQKPEPEQIKEASPEPLIDQDIVIYRVQFASSTKSKGSYTVKLGGKAYQSWEYLYKGAYRSCVGDYKKLSEAKIMQTKCRQSGYNQAFVVVFMNDERSLDRALFK